MSTIATPTSTIHHTRNRLVIRSAFTILTAGASAGNSPSGLDQSGNLANLTELYLTDGWPD
jgi:hypothetical protein